MFNPNVWVQLMNRIAKLQVLQIKPTEAPEKKEPENSENSVEEISCDTVNSMVKYPKSDNTHTEDNL